MNKQKGISQIVVMVIMLVLAIALPVTTKLVQKSQENRSKATIDTTAVKTACTVTCKITINNVLTFSGPIGWLGGAIFNPANNCAPLCNSLVNVGCGVYNATTPISQTACYAACSTMMPGFVDLACPPLCREIVNALKCAPATPTSTPTPTSCDYGSRDDQRNDGSIAIGGTKTGKYVIGPAFWLDESTTEVSKTFKCTTSGWVVSTSTSLIDCNSSPNRACVGNVTTCTVGEGGKVISGTNCTGTSSPVCCEVPTNTNPSVSYTGSPYTNSSSCIAKGGFCGDFTTVPTTGATCAVTGKISSGIIYTGLCGGDTTVKCCAPPTAGTDKACTDKNGICRVWETSVVGGSCNNGNGKIEKGLCMSQPTNTSYRCCVPNPVAPAPTGCGGSDLNCPDHQICNSSNACVPSYIGYPCSRDTQCLSTMKCIAGKCATPVAPTAVPTAKPTAVPTAKPTAVPTARPTAVPTAKPGATNGVCGTLADTCVSGNHGPITVTTHGIEWDCTGLNGGITAHCVKTEKVDLFFNFRDTSGNIVPGDVVKSRVMINSYERKIKSAKIVYCYTDLLSPDLNSIQAAAGFTVSGSRLLANNCAEVTFQSTNSESSLPSGSFEIFNINMTIIKYGTGSLGFGNGSYSIDSTGFNMGIYSAGGTQFSITQLSPTPTIAPICVNGTKECVSASQARVCVNNNWSVTNCNSIQVCLEGTCQARALADSIVNIKMAFAGVKPNNDQCATSIWPITLRLVNKDGSNPLDVTEIRGVPQKTEAVNARGEIVYNLTGTISGVPDNGATDLAFFIKGPKHLSLKYGVNRQSSWYNSFVGQLGLAVGTNNYDFSTYSLLAGDVTGNQSGVSDGKIDGRDYSFIKERSQPITDGQQGVSLAGDIDGNCMVNSGDVRLIKEALIEINSQTY